MARKNPLHPETVEGLAEELLAEGMTEVEGADIRATAENVGIDPRTALKEILSYGFRLARPAVRPGFEKVRRFHSRDDNRWSAPC